MLGSAWSVRFEDMDFLLRFGDDDFFLRMRMWTIVTDRLVVELTGRRLHRAGRAAVLCTGLGLQVPACVREVLREPPRAQVRRQLLTNFCTSFSQRFLQAHASHRSQAARDCLHHASLAGSEQVAESFGGVLFASPERQATSSFGSMSSVVDMTLLLKSPRLTSCGIPLATIWAVRKPSIIGFCSYLVSTLWW